MTDDTPLTAAEREELARLVEITNARSVKWDIWRDPSDPGFERAVLELLRRLVGQEAGR